MEKSRYESLSGDDAIVIAVDELLPRLADGGRLYRFRRHCGSDDIARERQLLID